MGCSMILTCRIAWISLTGMSIEDSFLNVKFTFRQMLFQVDRGEVMYL